MKVKIKAMHALLAQKGLMQSKADILAGYGVESSKDLTVTQLNDLLDWLKGQKTPTQHRQERVAAPPELRKVRSQSMDLLTRLGVYVDSGSWARVNAYLQQPQIGCKPLYDTTVADCVALNKKLYAILDKQLKVKAAIDHIAKNN